MVADEFSSAGGRGFDSDPLEGDGSRGNTGLGKLSKDSG